MDFILSYNNNEMVMPFPVVPNGGISLTRAQDNITFDGVNYELQAIGTMNLASFQYFPQPALSVAAPRVCGRWVGLCADH